MTYFSDGGGSRRVSARVLLLALACGAWLNIAPALAQDELYSANAGTHSVTVHNRMANGDIAPLRTLIGGATGLNGPRQVAVDTTHGEIFVGNFFSNSVTVYSRTASGNTAPLRTITGPATLLDFPVGVALDLVNDELLVVNRSNLDTSTSASVTVFSRTATGNATPLRVIAGPATGLNLSHGLAVDPVADEILVDNAADQASPPGIPSIRVFSRTADGDVAPIRFLSGGSTGLAGSIGLSLDRVHDEIMVANLATPSVTTYSRTASGDTLPLRTITGGSTGLNFPAGAFVDAARDEVLISNQNGNSITVYSRTATGNATPLRTLSGGATGLSQPGVPTVVFGPTLDVDGNGATDALTDGLLVLRFLFGFNGATLTTGAVGAGCTRCDAAAIVPYLESLR